MKNNKIYFIAASVAIFIIIINQIFIQYFLYQKKEDASIINIGGRQRMLSQRLLAQSLAELNQPSSTTNRKNIETTFQDWESAHLFLLKNFQERTFSTQNLFDSEILTDLKNLDPFFQKAKLSIENISDLKESEIKDLMTNQDDFLLNMNLIVKKLEKSANFKLNLLIGIEILFALISLSLIYYEINFVFKKMNRKLINKVEELKETNLTLEQYTYLAAHELRTPTQNLHNFTKLLKSKFADRSNVEETKFFEIIINSSNRLLTTTDDLMSMSSLMRDKINIEACDPVKILKEVLLGMREDIDKKNASIEWQNFPKSILADKILLQVVFQNLIANGIKFVAQDVIPQIKINYLSQDNQHFFTVEDNGIGISLEDQEKIFGMFKRLHNYEKYEGNGIGLSICKKALEKQNGEISLKSIPQKGSKFMIRLPKHINN